MYAFKKKSSEGRSDDYDSNVCACSFCSMLATRPLASTGTRIGLLKYSLLSKVLSPGLAAGTARFRKKRKAPSAATAITTSMTATVTPADPP